MTPESAERLASEIMADPEVALDVHAREELGVDPEGAGSPLRVALSSFAAFATGAFVPLFPWLFAEGNGAAVASVVMAVVAATLAGVALAIFTGRSKLRTALRPGPGGRRRLRCHVSDRFAPGCVCDIENSRSSLGFPRCAPLGVRFWWRRVLVVPRS